MKPNTIIKYMRLHIKEAKKFKERYSEEPNGEHDSDGTYIFSSRKEVSLNGLVFVFKGFKNNGYNPHFLTCAYNKDHEPVLQFNTFFTHSIKDSVITETSRNFSTRMYPDFFKISFISTIYIGGEKMDLKNQISKDEYFNLSLEYDMCPYELYLLGTKLHSSVSNTVEVLITTKLLEL